MQHKYTIYIDESGDAGIANVRTATKGGASPYMTLGAALLKNRSKKAAEQTLQDLKDEIGRKTLHCAQLNHYQLLYFARNIAARKPRLFGLISLKETLGQYKTDIAEDNKKYYNKCVQLLFERVGWFMEARDIPPENLDIVFEKANLDYNMMKNFLRACQQDPQHQNTGRLQNIDLDRIEVRKKDEEPLLQLADLVAHALYKCVDKQPKNHDIPEPRYLKELAPRFFGNPKGGAVVGAGLYCVHSTAQLKLDADVKEVLDNLIADAP